MNNNRSGIRGVGRGRVPHEGDERESVERHAVVGPRREVVLVHCPLSRGRGRLGRHETVLLAVGHAHRPDAERPQGVGGQDVLAQEADHQIAVRFGSGIGPVQVAFGLQKIIKFSYKFISIISLSILSFVMIFYLKY